MLRMSLLTPALMILLTAFHAQATEAVLPQDNSSAVIFVYHMVGEDQYPSSSIRTEQFEAHIKELQDGDYNVMPLHGIVSAIKAGTSLPNRTVALTFDGTHKSVLRNAVPLLLQAEIPFTLFLPTDYLDRVSDQYMDWNDVKKLARNRLVSIGLHPAAYAHLTHDSAEEIRRQINNARTRTREMLGVEPTLFAYPFGEFSAAYRNIVEDSGFEAAFGQQSSVAYTGSDMFMLPRFSMTESYGGLDRFELTALALPLPVTDVEPKDAYLTTAQPAIGFTVVEALKDFLPSLSCFASGIGAPHIEKISGTRVELRPESAFEEEHARINCTLPGPPPEPGEPQRWRWFGMLLTVAGAEKHVPEMNPE